MVGAIPLGQDDEWTVAERRYFSADSMEQLTTQTLSRMRTDWTIGTFESG